MSREALVLLAVCLLDTISSAYLFHHRLAVEANPLLRPFAESGTAAFLSVKLLTFIPALAVAEWYGRRRHEWVLPLLRWSIALYVGVYVIALVAQLAD